MSSCKGQTLRNRLHNLRVSVENAFNASYEGIVWNVTDALQPTSPQQKPNDAKQIQYGKRYTPNLQKKRSSR
jgi:hypothetical protein